MTKRVLTMYDLDNLVTNHSLDARLRESELESEVKLAESKADLIRWVVGANCTYFGATD